MRRFAILLLSVVILTITACEKDKRVIACTAQYFPPKLKFKVVNKITGADLFFSNPPAYSSNDIKVYFKYTAGKVDSIAPVPATAALLQYWEHEVRSSKQMDTCYIKIKNLKADTIIYSVSMNQDPCPIPVIVSATNNKKVTYQFTKEGILLIGK